MQPRRLVVVDPNVRPAVCGDRAAYVERFERWAALAHVMKLSDADAEWLYPGASYEDVAGRVLERGALLVVVSGALLVALRLTLQWQPSKPTSRFLFAPSR